MQFYSDPKRQDETFALPDCEVFYAEQGAVSNDEGEPLPEGFYYWYCLPGCLPDSEPYGPFETEDDAIADCRDNAGY